MANPKRRHSNMRTRLRRTHDALTSFPTVLCPNCKARIFPHRVCPQCGYYRGRQVLTLTPKEKKP